jgi:hypothetical protein
MRRKECSFFFYQWREEECVSGLKKSFFIKGFKVKYSVLIKQLHQQTQT